MTKKLSELFNLPEALPEDVSAEQATQQLQQHQSTFAEIDSAIDKIDSALPGVRGLEASDAELDELADLAKEKFNDLMDLGMAMEARFSGTVFQTAGTLLGHAITAKQAKLDKKLRMVDLQLKKLAIDKKNDKEEKDIEGEGYILTDRNSILEKLKHMNK